MSDLLTLPTFITGDVPPDDESPPTPFEYACETCGKELHYGGRGRKPKYCDEHKRGGSTTPRKNLGKNDVLAAQATEALCQMNSISAIGLMMFGLPTTASAINNAHDSFREQAYNALLTDPDLCRKILKGGTGSGKIALVIAYGMLGAAVVPVAHMEIKEKRAERDRLRAEAAEDDV